VPLLINLGHALRNAAEFSGDAEHYRAAAETYREVLAGHTNTTQMTSVNAGLGVTLGQLAKIEHDPTLLGEAAVLLRQALTTRGVPEEIRVEAANNLSGLVLTQLEMGTATDDDLDALITLLESAVDIGRRTSWAATALNLAEVLRKRTKDGDLAAARRWYRAAADNPASPTWVRVYAARMWGGLADNPDEVIAGYTQAVGLLPRLAWRGLPSREQQRELGRLNGISSEAAAAALTAGRPETAVELLEHGRSVLWNQLMSARTDVSAATLRAAAESRPDLTDELTRVRAELAQAAPEPAAGAGLPPELAAGQERMALAHREEQVLAEIAVITGVNGAVRKRPFAELRHAAADGPVVLVNVSRRCDAIVLHPDGAPQVVRLDTDHAEVQRRAEQVVTAWRRPGVGGYASAQETLAEVLDWAWHTVTGPVLDALDGEAGMRVWWCPTGPLTLIPLHAAADLRSPAPQRDALARITSSATSTLSALLDARARTTAAPERILVVGVSHPEGLPPLPGVPGEVETVRTHAAPAPNVLTGPEATVDRVLQDLPEHAWLHVAGHGHQDLADPSNSGLSLHDRRLTVTELTGLRLDNAQFAFLSACEASAATRIPDEAIHPAAALQFAGFRHVVATLWPIPDQTGTELTGALYSAIGTDADAAPSALREAVRQVRSRHPYEPTTWASYVHWGP
jgi:CHAT domain-containing protein